MAHKTLSFSLIQSNASRRIEFPLHPQTVNQVQVGKILEAVLNGITREINTQGKVSDGDVLQALCMALAIRMHMVDAPLSAARELVAMTLDQADDAMDHSLLQVEGKA
jgi:hypothetical protein